MPNGYTAPIYDNETIAAASLAARFARSLGFTIHQRDYDISVPPARREPGTYYVKRIEELEAERKRLLEMSDQEVADELEAEYTRIKAYNDEQVAKHYAMRKRYDKAIQVFTDWPAVTTSGQRVKQAAIEQLEESKQFDCGGEPYKRQPPTRHRKNEWREERLADNLQSLERARTSLREEQQRCDEVNQWIDDLYADVQSLEGIVLNDD